ncbi:MAG TPA: response regulator transcription factor [Pirellulales bacterium]|nr:response regulator transcription factor [Pirellulales bacterium]
MSIVNDRVLVVDDQKDLTELVRYNLLKEGYLVTCVNPGEDATDGAQRQIPGILVVDLLLPKVDGAEAGKPSSKKADGLHGPDRIAPGEGEFREMMNILEHGRDRCGSNSANPRLLHIRGLLDRSSKTAALDEPEVLQIGNLFIHPGRHEVLVDGVPVELTFTEFRMLHFLAQRPGWACTRNQIVEAIRGENYPVTLRSVDVQVVGLRKKLGPIGASIETVRGVGYRFRELGSAG